ncbi:endo/excinuclease amino terminal domain-containing protein [Galdieria sulphuraria]|uniref:Structure-specific endonuclease subunit SLX1 homolog n=1 Tax=Galdieria sulphuraria TaxID=130081 RepID=M2XP28_GALSU|nr:endo/excinuclease amino terminal domain-containing protein [Galdieria sulphuraria]EME31922.1 endo/excinuclease amino terminal domain-containing protein [Galdieria sulphuraria]|eukprot:XP_005708442.1 endo/excinuclease amino terminal domain-containing protein [Galdieria sulphuraria]
MSLTRNRVEELFNTTLLSSPTGTISEEEDSFPFPELRVRLENKFNTTTQCPASSLEGDLHCHEETHSDGFYCCYLLRSLSEHPYGKNRTYIGFTTNPARRLRQHNGDLKAGGALRTKCFRPWQMVLFIHGFETKTEALQFEWAWQHPTKTRALKPVNNDSSLHSKNTNETNKQDSRKSSKYSSGISGKVKILIDLVRSPHWSNHTLMVTFLEEAIADCSELLFKTSHLPLNVQTNILPFEEMGCLNESKRKQRFPPQKSLQDTVRVEKHKDNQTEEKWDTMYSLLGSEIDVVEVSSTDSDELPSDSDSTFRVGKIFECPMETLTKIRDDSKPLYEIQISEHFHTLALTNTPKKNDILHSRNACSPDCPSCSRYCSRRRIVEKMD